MTLNESIFIFPNKAEMKNVLEEIDTADEHLSATFFPDFLALSDGIFSIEEIAEKVKKIVDDFVHRDNYPYDMEDTLHHLAGDIVVAAATYGLRKYINKKLGL